MTQPDSTPDEVLQLRSARAKYDRATAALDEARKKQAELEDEINNLLEQKREARKERNEAVLAADAVKVPRLRIAKEAGMQRSNVYKLLDDGSTSDS